MLAAAQKVVKEAEYSGLLFSFPSKRTSWCFIKVVKVSKKTAVEGVQRDYFREPKTAAFQSRACLSPHLVLTFPLALTPSRAKFSLL